MKFNCKIVAIAIALASGDGVRADYSSTVIGQGALGYYRLNETTQPPPDTAANAGSLAAAAAGSYQGSVAHPVLPGALAAGTNGALRANGGGVIVPASSDLNREGAFTAEFWAKPAAANTGTTLTCPFASIEVAGSGRIGWLFYQAAGGWNFRIGNDTGYTGNLTAGTVTAGEWQHVVGVFTADGTVILYVNGAEVGRQTGKAFTPNTATPLGIGIRGDSSFAFGGDVDEAALYPAALSAAEVAARYQAGTNAAPSTPYEAVVKAGNPLGYWRLGDPDNTVFAANLGSSGAAKKAAYVAGAMTGVGSLRPAAFAGFEAGNTGVQFDGTQGGIRIPSPDVNTNRFTVSAWLFPGDPQPSFAGLVFARAANLAATGFGYTEGNQLGYHWGDAAESYNFRSGLVPPANTWSYVAMVVEPTQAIFYLHDGTTLQSATNTFAHGPLNLAAEFAVGQDPGNTARRYLGSIDEIALFARSLDAGEILTQYYAGKGNAQPEILVAPSAPTGTIYGGSDFSLSVTAAGTPPLQYEWRKGATLITGATGPTLTVTNSQIADSGSYTVTVRNGSGNVASSAVAITVAALTAPVIVTAPQPITRYVGGTARFSVVAEGSPPLTYQWLQGTAPITNATSATLILTNVPASAAGDYSVTVRNAAGPITTAAARLTLVTPTPGSYPAVVVADQPVAYWRLGEASGETAVDLAGGFDGTYANGYTLGQPGALKDNPDTAAGFDGAQAKVEVDPTTALNPAQFTIEAWAKVVGGEGSYRSPLTSRDDGPQRGYIFYATPDNVWNFWTGKGDSSGWDSIVGPPVAPGEWTHLVATYDGTTKRFYVNGSPVGTSTAAFAPNVAKPLRIGGGATDSVAGDFFFNGDLDEVAVYAQALSPERISLHYGAGLGAGTPPTFSRQPSARAVLPGATVSFAVTAAGSLPLSYQWRKGNADLPGATNATFSLTNVVAATGGEYRCVVRNPAGVVTSEPAVLTVVTIPEVAYRAAILADNPVAYWRLGETNGEVAVDEKTTHPGTYLNGVTLGTPGVLTTDTNRSATFQAGSQTKVEVPWTADLNPATAFSIEIWARVTGGAGNYRSPLTSRADGPQRGYIFYATPDNLWQFWTGKGDTTGWDVVNGPAVVNNAWTHLAATYDGTTKRFYVNGSEVGASTAAFAPNDEQVLRLGAGASEDPVGNFFFEGNLDEAAIYNTVLSPATILIHHALGTKTAAAPTVAIIRGTTGLQLEWTSGTLQRSTALGSPWIDVLGTSPLSVDPNAPAGFYRVKR